MTTTVVVIFNPCYLYYQEA